MFFGIFFITYLLFKLSVHIKHSENVPLPIYFYILNYFIYFIIMIISIYIVSIFIYYLNNWFLQLFMILIRILDLYLYFLYQFYVCEGFYHIVFNKDHLISINNHLLFLFPFPYSYFLFSIIIFSHPYNSNTHTQYHLDICQDFYLSYSLFPSIISHLYLHINSIHSQIYMSLLYVYLLYFFIPF